MNYQIESIELNGFTGMWLNDVKHFKMTLAEITTLILGRNGCGKSRLISVMNPLAAHRKELNDGGMKRFIFIADGERFCVTSIRKGKGIKTTLENLTKGTVLLDGVNPTVHNKLVKDMFKYDHDLHDVLTGNVVLTKMKTPERRKWFSLLSESDLTYALDFYKKSREHNRDISGSIKSLKFSIGKLRPTVIECEDDRNATKARLATLQKDISTIDRMIDRAGNVDDVNEATLTGIESVLDSISREVMGLNLVMPESLANVNRRTLENELLELNVNYKNTLARVEEIQERLAKAIAINNVDTGVIEKSIDEFREYIEESKAEFHLYPELYSLPESLLLQTHRQSKQFCDVITEAVSVMTTSYPLDNLPKRVESLKSHINKLTESINLHKHRESTLTGLLKHAESITAVECENCHHSFKPGVHEAEIAGYKEELGNIADTLLGLIKDEQNTREKLDIYCEFTRVKSNYEGILLFQQNNPAFIPLRDVMDNKKVFDGNGGKDLAIVTQYRTELELACTVSNTITKLNNAVDELALANAMQAEDTTVLKSMYDSSELALTKLSGRRKEVNSVLNALDTVEREMARGDALNQELEEAMYSHIKTSNILIENVKVEVLNEHRQNLWDLLITTRQRFDDMERERLRLEDQELQLDELVARYESTSKVVKAMSPDEGILAKYLYQCINRITDLMSNYINHIWGYEMQILPCDVAEGDMDYKFPFWVKDAKHVNDDISEGSKAQKEVIDFVFVLAVYRALGLEQWPIFLDELTSGFDEGHRDEMMVFIKQLIANGHHLQVIMVSHDPTMHFKLTHADIVILDTAGITVPAKYNKNVLIN